MSRGKSGYEIQNDRFRPKLKRKPKALECGHYIYAPTMLTKHKTLASKTQVKIVGISARKDDPIVEVQEWRSYSLRGEVFQVFWEDLRR